MASLAEFSWNLKRLLRDGFLDGLPLDSLQTEYKKYFNFELLEPAEYQYGCGTWIELFKRCAALKDSIKLCQVQGQPGVKAKPLRERHLRSYFRLVNYVNFTMKRQADDRLGEEDSDYSDSGEEGDEGDDDDDGNPDDTLESQVLPNLFGHGGITTDSTSLAISNGAATVLAQGANLPNGIGINGIDLDLSQIQVPNTHSGRSATPAPAQLTQPPPITPDNITTPDPVPVQGHNPSDSPSQQAIVDSGFHESLDLSRSPTLLDSTAVVNQPTPDLSLRATIYVAQPQTIEASLTKSSGSALGDLDPEVHGAASGTCVGVNATEPPTEPTPTPTFPEQQSQAQNTPNPSSNPPTQESSQPSEPAPVTVVEKRNSSTQDSSALNVQQKRPRIDPESPATPGPSRPAAQQIAQAQGTSSGMSGGSRTVPLPYYTHFLKEQLTECRAERELKTAADVLQTMMIPTNWVVFHITESNESASGAPDRGIFRWEDENGVPVPRKYNANGKRWSVATKAKKADVRLPEKSIVYGELAVIVEDRANTLIKFYIIDCAMFGGVDLSAFPFDERWRQCSELLTQYLAGHPAPVDDSRILMKPYTILPNVDEVLNCALEGATDITGRNAKNVYSYQESDGSWVLDPICGILIMRTESSFGADCAAAASVVVTHASFIDSMKDTWSWNWPLGTPLATTIEPENRTDTVGRWTFLQLMEAFYNPAP